jgi:DNA mismatch repair protein MutS2
MERKLKQLIIDWKKAEGQEDKRKLVVQMQQLLFRKQQQQKTEKARQVIEERFKETGEEITVGKKVLLVKSHQAGEVKEIRGKNAVVQVGLIAITLKSVTRASPKRHVLNEHYRLECR